ncbi:hypothetical protein [Plantibacter sp. RU18]|uniref:hypothetical protein n=1 Tax=Plantibacter sp. RU18 TaxID=3158143 RepID=UPI003D35AE87
MAKKKIYPALFATLVMTPAIVLQFLLPLVGIGSMSTSDIGGVLAIDVIFWLLIFFISYLMGRKRAT